MSAMMGLGRGLKGASAVQGPQGRAAHAQEQLGRVPEEDARSHLRTCAHTSGAVQGSKGINIKPRSLLERSRSAAMYIMYQDLNGLSKKIPYRQAKE